MNFLNFPRSCATAVLSFKIRLVSFSIFFIMNLQKLVLLFPSWFAKPQFGVLTFVIFLI